MKFDEIIRKEIKASGLTAKEVSQRCGISEQALHKRIRVGNMKVSSIQQLSEILNRNLFQALSINYEHQENN